MKELQTTDETGLAMRPSTAEDRRSIPVPEPLSKRVLYVEPLRGRMRVRFGGNWIADSEHVVLLFEPAHKSA